MKKISFIIVGFLLCFVCSINVQAKTLKEEILSQNEIYDNPTLTYNTSSTNLPNDPIGLYVSYDTDDGRPTYYYRGEVGNNYVLFANLIWRIIRINEDGSIRMTLHGFDGVTTRFFTETPANYSYMYYSNGKSNVNYNIKVTNDKWYKDRLLNYDNYIVNSNFCQAVSVTDYSASLFGKATAVDVHDYVPTFKCETDGNGYRYYNGKVGLITYPEAAFSGMNNFRSFLETSNTYWYFLMTPGGYTVRNDGGYSFKTFVNKGYLSTLSSDSNYYLKPVINIGADVPIVEGKTGTNTSPYEFKNYSSISFNSMSNGSISVDKQKAYTDETITMTFNPNTGYKLKNVTVKDANDNEIEVNENTFIMPDTDVNISAEFELIVYEYELNNNDEKGTFTFTSNNEFKYNYYHSFRITCNPNNDIDSVIIKDANNNDVEVTQSSSTSYSDNDNNLIIKKEYKFRMPASNINITVNYKDLYYNILKTFASNGTVDVSATTAKHGDIITITPTPNEGYETQIVRYCVAKDVTSTSCSGQSYNVTPENGLYKITMPSNNMRITVGFSKINYNIIKNVTGSNYGTLSTSKTIANFQDHITFDYIPRNDGMLESLSIVDENGNNIAFNNKEFIMPSKNITINATFKATEDDKFNITIQNSSLGTITTNVNSASYNELVTINFEDNLYYLLESVDVYDKYGYLLFNTKNMSFNMPAIDVKLVPHYIAIKYNINLINTQNLGTFEIANESLPDIRVPFNYEPIKGYKISSVDVIDSNSNDISVDLANKFFIMPTSDVMVLVSFEKNDYNVTINPTTHGTVSLDKEKHIFEEEQEIIITPDEDYELNTITVTSAECNGECSYPIVDNKFVMPGCDVTVNATFRHKNDVYVEYLNNIKDQYFNNIPKFSYTESIDTLLKRIDIANMYITYFENLINDDSVTVDISASSPSNGNTIYLSITLSKNGFDGVPIQNSFSLSTTYANYYNPNPFKTKYNNLEINIPDVYDSMYYTNLCNYAKSIINNDYENDNLSFKCFSENDSVANLYVIKYDQNSNIILDHANMFVNSNLTATYPYSYTIDEVSEEFKNTLNERYGIEKSNIRLEYDEEYTNNNANYSDIGYYDIYINNQLIKKVYLKREYNPITSITITNPLNETFVRTKENNSYKYEISITPSDAIYEPIEWKTNYVSTSVAQDGTVTFLSSGYSVIQVCSNNVCASTQVRNVSEPENVLDTYVASLKTISTNSYSATLLNNDEHETKILNYEFGLDNIENDRISYEISNVTTDSSYKYYYVDYKIDNLEGIYTKTVTYKVKIVTSTIDTSNIKDNYQISFNHLFSGYIDNDTSLLNSYLGSNSYLLINSSKNREGLNIKNTYDLFVGSYNSFVDYKTIEFTIPKSIEVPYIIRTENDLIEYVDDYEYILFGWLNNSNISIEKNNELTNSTTFDQENLGVYNITNNNYTYPIKVLRVENKLTNIEITNKSNNVILDGNDYYYKIQYKITPSDAIYEKVIFKSSDTSVVIIDNNGLVKPKKVGTTIISVCDETETVCDQMELSITNKSSSNIIKTDEGYEGRLFLYDNGDLYYSGEYSNNHLILVEQDVKDILVRWDNYYYVLNNGDLYSLNIYHRIYTDDNEYEFEYDNLLYSNVKNIYESESDNSDFYIVTNDNKLYIHNSEETKYLLDNVIRVDKGMSLTSNNDVYVYGENIYGEKINGNKKITTPMLFYSNVKDFSYDGKYVLLNDGDFIVFSSSATNAKVVDTNVDAVVKSDEYNDYYISKNGNIEHVSTYIEDKNIVVDSRTQFDFSSNNFVYDYNNIYYIDSNVLHKFKEHDKTDTIIMDNVKQVFNTSFDYTGNNYVHFITNDNKLYRLYENEVYYITNNILRFDEDNKLFVTTDNDYWNWGYNYYGQLGINSSEEDVDYPSKLVKSNESTISVKGIYIYEGTRKDITVGDIEDILAIVLPYNSTNQNIIWSVSDSNVAKISNNGKLTALSEGTVTIYAETEDGNYRTSFKINVHPRPSTIKIHTQNDSRVIGNNTSSSFDYSFEIYAKVGNENVVDRKVIWRSSDSSVVKVESESYCYMWDDDGNRIEYDGCATIRVSNKTGTATITATTSDGRIQDSIVYNVVQNSSVVALSQNSVAMSNRATYDIKNILQLNGFDINNLEFYANDYVVSVNQNGIITANNLGYGDVYIKSKLANNYGNELLYLSVNVKDDYQPKLYKAVIKSITGNNNTLTINIDSQRDAQSYYIYRSENKKKWIKIATVSDPTYTNKSLTYGKTYYYKVAAYNSKIGKSTESNISSKKVVPNKVTNLTISKAGTNNINLSWDKVSVTGYEVYRSEDNKKWTKVTTITKSGTLTYNNKKLKANKKYYYKVRAYKTVSGKKIYGSYSSVVSTKTAPNKPSISLSLKDIDSMNLVISSTSGASKYIVQKSLDDKTYTTIEELPGPGTLEISELEIGKTYYLAVKACNVDNRCSGWSKVNLKQTTKTPSLKLESTKSKKVTVTIGNVNGADGYRVYRSTSKNGKYELVKEVLNGEELTFNDSTKKGVTYYYKVRSYKVVDGSKVYSPFGKIKSIKSK